jgi:hypothetical protein
MTISGKELDKWPLICMWLQITHEDPDICKVMLDREDAATGDKFRRGYFRIYKGNYLHYKMEFYIEDFDQQIISRELIWLQVYDSYLEYEAARVRTLQSVPADQQDGFSLN